MKSKTQWVSHPTFLRVFSYFFLDDDDEEEAIRRKAAEMFIPINPEDIPVAEKNREENSKKKKKDDEEAYDSTFCRS